MLQDQKQKGFSLVELLLVVAIIGIISAIAIPSLAGARRAAHRASAISTLRILHTDQVSHLVQFGRYGRLGELNQKFHSNSLGQIAGPTLRRSEYVFLMAGVVPSFASLETAYTIYATGTNADGSPVYFAVDESGVISQLP